jgi:hypothetical protein
VVWLESLINGEIESNPSMQAEAVRRGIKVSGFADPTMVPIEHAIHGLCLLGDDGTVTRFEGGELLEWRALGRFGATT